MGRHKKSVNRPIVPDSRYNSQVVSKFVTRMMLDGKTPCRRRDIPGSGRNPRHPQRSSCHEMDHRRSPQPQWSRNGRHSQRRAFGRLQQHWFRLQEKGRHPQDGRSQQGFRPLPLVDSLKPPSGAVFFYPKIFQKNLRFLLTKLPKSYIFLKPIFGSLRVRRNLQFRRNRKVSGKTLSGFAVLGWNALLLTGQ